MTFLPLKQMSFFGIMRASKAVEVLDGLLSYLRTERTPTNVSSGNLVSTARSLKATVMPMA
jgi:hypothetical protein